MPKNILTEMYLSRQYLSLCCLHIPISLSNGYLIVEAFAYSVLPGIFSTSNI